MGVATFAEKILNVECLTSWGQSESLTDRLRTLLDGGYKDGLSIFRETIQNADDAGATCVKYCYDARTNAHWRNPLRLLDPAMASAQGAALVVYNDSKFSEDDFANIIRLGSGSKRDSAEKIGKFGLGFNVVYNVTDIPSILSGTSLVFLDPTRKFMPNRLRAAASPGIRVNFAERNAKYLNHWRDQFKTYENVFGCGRFENDHGRFEYAGTLIRLPLRSMPSEISSNLYDSESEIGKLLEILLANAETMLLFAQSVRLVEVYVLRDNNNDDNHNENNNNMKLLFRFEKSLRNDWQNVRKHDVLDLDVRFHLEICQQSSLLRAASCLLKKQA